MYTRSSASRSLKSAGFTIVELVMFIVIVGVAVAGVMLVYSTTVRGSADPLATKQMLSIAEAMLEEVELQPFTYCDPDDTQAAVATSSADCTGGTGGPNDESKLPLGPEGTESRATAADPFDNVSDYNGFNSATISDLSGATIASLAGYGVQVSVSNSAFGPSGAEVAATDSLLITVVVTSPRGDTLSLSGYRSRYAPNGVP